MNRFVKIAAYFILTLFVPLVYFCDLTDQIAFMSMLGFIKYPIILAQLVLGSFAIGFKERLLIIYTMLILILTLAARPLTEQVVEAQGRSTLETANRIIDDIYAFHDKNRSFPVRLSEASMEPQYYYVGIWRCRYEYCKSDSTFKFYFPTKGGGEYSWVDSRKEWVWYD